MKRSGIRESTRIPPGFGPSVLHPGYIYFIMTTRNETKGYPGFLARRFMIVIGTQRDF